MVSLWKDLLFLHGYFARREDLLWREQTGLEPASRPTARTANGQAGTGAKGKAKPSKDCPRHWPRLAAPR